MRVLISGASIAGPILAYWLARAGAEPVVVERTPVPRFGIGGHAVDLFAPAMDVIGRMGLDERVRAAGTGTKVLRYERAGKPSADIDLRTISADVAAGAHVEIMRGTLANILYEATRDEVDYVFGDSISELFDGPSGVDVTFDSGRTHNFDLVIGADGLHSTVRRLAFGADERFLNHLGGYLAVFSLPNELGLGEEVVLYNEVDRIAATYRVPGTDHARAVILFRRKEQLTYDHRDVGTQKLLLQQELASGRGRLPEMVRHVDAADDFYFDSISQIRAGDWFRGRIGMVGDAAYAPGPAVGGGTTTAAVGAYMLATSLASAAPDHSAGFAAYEHSLREYVQRCAAAAPKALRTGIPRSRIELTLAGTATRALHLLPPRLRHRVVAGGVPDALSSFTLPD